MIGTPIPLTWSTVALGYATVQGSLVVGLIRGRALWSDYVLAPLAAAPATVAAGLGVVMASTWVSGPLFGLAVCAASGYAGGRLITRDAGAGRSVRRGAMLSPAKSPRFRKRAHAGEGITLAGAAVAEADETKHFKLIGTTGTGKSTAIREILCAALARGDRAVIADPDGGYLQQFHEPARGDVILNPFDQRSAKWDLFAEIKQPFDVDQLARSLIPDRPGSDPVWTGYARTFFGAATRQMHEAGLRDTGELYRFLISADIAEIKALVGGTAAQPFLNDHNARFFDSIRSVTSDAVQALQYVAEQRSTPMSVRQWVQDERPGVLFMPYKAGQIASLRSVISAWMRLAIFEKMDHEPRSAESGAAQRRMWFVVDELDALGQIDGLKDALARLRKFGGRCVLGFQSIAQVSSTYGQGDAHTIVENCGNSLILRCSASEGGGTARFASQLIGDREVIRTTVSTSRRSGSWFPDRTYGEHISIEPALLPAQLEQLPDLSGYLKLASAPEWRRVELRTPAAAARPREAAPARSAVAHAAVPGAAPEPVAVASKSARQNDHGLG
jgi:type IV secretory pathway TraG/TraD family ATPase VirD4